MNRKASSKVTYSFYDDKLNAKDRYSAIKILPSPVKVNKNNDLHVTMNPKHFGIFTNHQKENLHLPSVMEERQYQKVRATDGFTQDNS